MAVIPLRQLSVGCRLWVIVGILSAALHGASGAFVVLAVTAIVDAATTATDGSSAHSTASMLGRVWVPLVYFVAALLAERVAALVTGLASTMCAETSAAQLAYRRLVASQQSASGRAVQETLVGQLDSSSYGAALKDVQARLPEVWTGLFAIVRRSMMVIAAIVLIAWYSVGIAALLMVVSMFTVWWELRQGKLLAEQRSQQRLSAAHAARVREVALVEQHTAELVFLNTRDWLSHKHQKLAAVVTRVARKLLQRVLAGVVLTTLLRGIALVAVVVFLLNQVAAGQVSVASFVAQVLALRLASNATSILHSTWSGLEANLQMVKPYLEPIQAVSPSLPAVATPKPRQRPEDTRGAPVVAITNLKTRFAQTADHRQSGVCDESDSRALGLDIPHLSVDPGEKVVLLGENGSGKTTLLESLIGLHTPDSGDVLIDGVPPAEAWSERTIYVMPQSPLKLPLSLRDNICCGVSADDSVVQEACERVGLIATAGVPGLSLDTVLSGRHGGQDLSGGQWQRVALARMLVHVRVNQSALILMDEPVSAADLALEELVPTLFAEELADVATIAVTHRLSLAQHVDTVWVMAQGRVVEHGTPKSLRSRRGIYQTWLELQRSQGGAKDDTSNVWEGL